MLGFMAIAAAPAKQVKAKLSLKTDTAITSPRHFDKAALKQYSLQKEFHYNDGSYVGDSLWTRFWRWFWNLFTIDDKKTAGEIFVIIIKYALIVLGAAALIFLILRLIGLDAFNIIKGKPLTLAYNESVEDIYAIDLDTEVENAVTQQNYRFAVRLLYLKVLKQLSDAGKIHWEINKTNSVYINELTDAEQRIAFKLLTRQFEYVWYGELIIDAEVFKKINGLFTSFKIKTA
jgi:ABC-type dipeptide/oligopeptide/nickel transport system permease component